MANEMRGVSKATITSKGQITIPKRIREQLNLRTGDKVDFVIEDERAILRPVRVSVLDLEGVLHEPGRKPLSLDEMKRVIQKRAAERNARD